MELPAPNSPVHNACDSTSYVISPYLQAAAPRVESRVLARWEQQLGQKLLSRRVVYDHLNRRAVAITPREFDQLATLKASREEVSLPRDGHRFFREAELLLPVHDAYRRHAYECVEIEINRHCNYRCAFCPVKDLAKPRAFMSNGLFSQIAEKIAHYGARYVTLHHYSEPTLDPELCSKVSIAAQFGLRIRLHTNASLLNEERIQSLKRSGNVALVIVNLPTVDPDGYARVTQSSLFDRVIQNLELLSRAGLPLQLSVNLPRNTGQRELERINEKYGGALGKTRAWLTTSRAGLLEAPEYTTKARNEGLLDGCVFAATQLNVSFEGKVFLCCMDYHQGHVLGDLTRESLEEIAEGPVAVSLRREIFGQDLPNSGLLCAHCEWTRGRERGKLTLGGDLASNALLRPNIAVLVSGSQQT